MSNAWRSVRSGLGDLGETYLLGGGIVDGGDETADLVAHGLGGDAGGGGLEVDVAGATDPGDGVGAGVEGGHAGAGERTN